MLPLTKIEQTFEYKEFSINISEVDVVEVITAAAAVAAVGAAAAAGAAGGGGGGSGLSSMAGSGPVPSGLPQPGTSKQIKLDWC